MSNHKAKPPFFVFGFERSGTTLLAMMLGAHPEMAVPFSVTGLWYRYWDRLGEYGGLKTDEDLHRLIDDLLKEERIKLWDVDLDREELLQYLSPGNYAAVVEQFHTIYAARKYKASWGNADIATLERMDAAKMWFPNARFVHIVRDGRDVALSHDEYVYGATNTLECAQEWRSKVHVNLKMGAMLDSMHYFVVRYEDLVLQPRATLERICSFVGVDYSPAMLKYPDMVSTKIPESRRALWPLIDKAPQANNAYRWKRQMGSVRRIVIERTASPLLARLGYETYDYLPRNTLSYLYEFFCFLGQGHRLRRLLALVPRIRNSKRPRKRGRRA